MNSTQEILKNDEQPCSNPLTEELNRELVNAYGLLLEAKDVATLFKSTSSSILVRCRPGAPLPIGGWLAREYMLGAGCTGGLGL